MALKKRVALAQYPLTAHISLSDWQHHLDKWVIDAVNQGSEILVFPEYGSLELLSTMEDAASLGLAEQMRALQPLLKTFDTHVAALARRYQLTIVAPSVPVQRGDFLINEAWIYSRSGKRHTQGKYHMTRFEAESWGVVPSPPALIVFDDQGFRFGVQICFDVEFATASALLAREGAHAIFAPSCTETLAGQNRVHVGARARALENQLFVGVAQTVGSAPWCEAIDINRGQAALFGPPDLGFPENGIIAQGQPDQAAWLVCDLDPALVENVRQNGTVFNHQHNQIDFQQITWFQVTEIRL